MNGNDIRTKFLAYFEKNGHSIEESSSLVPKDDPTLLFTNAGMVQFKRVFMGDDKRDFVRAVTSQRCVRAGGKHNDLENVGYTARHHTFFEMLGNFSFGDYFKEDAIRYGWEFLIKELGLPAEKMWVSVFEDDDEAFGLWEKVEGLPEGRIVRLGEKDNFWAMGDTGPCGPCSEIHIDLGRDVGCDRKDCAVGCDCDRFLELWNLVFMQFNRAEDGTLTPLPKPSIDTGMGLERVAAVLQGKFNNYDSDLFAPIINKLVELSGRDYEAASKSDTTAMRVIADHARATAFLVADGVLPSNEGRGYVLRRIMRRAVRYGKTLGLEKLFMGEVTAVVVAAMQDAYPHLEDAAKLLAKVTENEEQRFRETLEHGLNLLEDEIARGEKLITGDFIFKLYDTYGFPMDIVRDISLERGLEFDEAGFRKAMEHQRSQSRASRKDAGVETSENGVRQLREKGQTSEFTGYDTLNTVTTVQALLTEAGEIVAQADSGMTVRLFTEKTPFYAESGGQTGDRGEAVWQGGRGVIVNTESPEPGIILHTMQIEEGALQSGNDVTLTVSEKIRANTAANHSATHLLQSALQEVLGEHVKQSGSLVGPERLRFDFTHFSQMTAKEIRSVEYRVNAEIRKNQQVITDLLSKDEAIKEGATALFGERYGETVRVVSMGDYSKELCGGTHLPATGSIGLFTILSEAGIASGVRRIEALAGAAAIRAMQAGKKREQQLATVLNVPAVQVADKVSGLMSSVSSLEKQVAALSAELASTDLDQYLKERVTVSGIGVIAHEIPLDNQKTLRDVGDKIRDKLDTGIAVLGGEVNGKVALLAIVSKDLTDRIQAGAIVNKVAAIVGGKGGGRPDMAQAGGSMVDKLSQAIKAVPEIVEDLLAE